MEEWGREEKRARGKGKGGRGKGKTLKIQNLTKTVSKLLRKISGGTLKLIYLRDQNLSFKLWIWGNNMILKGGGGGPKYESQN